MFTEIEKLHDLLTNANIPHAFVQMPTMFGNCYQIRMYADKNMIRELDDAVCHNFSHGYHLGLLETFVLGDCDGYETADDVFVGWQKMFNEFHEKA